MESVGEEVWWDTTLLAEQGINRACVDRTLTYPVPGIRDKTMHAVERIVVYEVCGHVVQEIRRIFTVHES